MSQPNPSTNGRMIPAMRYRNAPAAVDWLCKAFGFEKHLVVPGEGETIRHAQLTLGNGMIMVGSVRDDEPNSLPSDIGTVTQAPYIVVHEIDDHYQRAKAADAEIVYDIADQPHGGRLYTARDPEGHLWNFGSYDPWATV